MRKIFLLIIAISLCLASYAQTKIVQGSSQYGDVILNIQGKLPSAVLIFLMM